MNQIRYALFCGGRRFEVNETVRTSSSSDELYYLFISSHNMHSLIPQLALCISTFRVSNDPQGRAPDSINALSFLDRDGCRSFLSAFASICRIRSRVTAKCWPTSSSVCSLPLGPSPKRIFITFSSRGVKDFRTSSVISRRLEVITASAG